MRRTAKIVNFGLLYGAGPFRMSNELGIPQKEAKQIIETYFNRYSGIKDYIEKTIEQAKSINLLKLYLVVDDLSGILKVKIICIERLLSEWQLICQFKVQMQK